MSGNSCCGSASETNDLSADRSESTCDASARIEADWITGYMRTAIGEVPLISTKLRFKDTLGSWKCRWSIGRMNYKVEPGIYGVGCAAAVIIGFFKGEAPSCG